MLEAEQRRHVALSSRVNLKLDYAFPSHLTRQDPPMELLVISGLDGSSSIGAGFCPFWAVIIITLLFAWMALNDAYACLAQ